MAMSLKQFEKVVEAAAERLPRRFKDILKKEGIQLLARESAPEALLGEEPVYGMFLGTPYTERSVFEQAYEPTRIELYRDAFIADFGDDREELLRQIEITVIHEVGHYFGFSEEQLEEYLED